jgi:hypothetical protein
VAYHFFFPARAFAHLFSWAALIRARPSAEMRRRPRLFRKPALPPALTLFHRALCAAAILRRAANGMVRRPVRAERRLPARRWAILSAMDSRAAIARSSRSRSARSCCMTLSRFGISADCSMQTWPRAASAPCRFWGTQARSTPGIPPRADGAVRVWQYERQSPRWTEDRRHDSKDPVCSTDRAALLLPRAKNDFTCNAGC